MTNKKSIICAIGVIIFNLLLGHFLAPTGLILAPIALIASSTIVVFKSANLRPLYLMLIILGLMVLLDLGLKLYAGQFYKTLNLYGSSKVRRHSV